MLQKKGNEVAAILEGNPAGSLFFFFGPLPARQPSTTPHAGRKDAQRWGEAGSNARNDLHKDARQEDGFSWALRKRAVLCFDGRGGHSAGASHVRVRWWKAVGGGERSPRLTLRNRLVFSFRPRKHAFLDLGWRDGCSIDIHHMGVIGMNEVSWIKAPARSCIAQETEMKKSLVCGRQTRLAEHLRCRLCAKYRKSSKRTRGWWRGWSVKWFGVRGRLERNQGDQTFQSWNFLKFGKKKLDLFFAFCPSRTKVKEIKGF